MIHPILEGKLLMGLFSMCSQINPGRSPVSQTYYWTLFNGYYLCSILTFTSIDSREELLKAWFREETVISSS